MRSLLPAHALGVARADLTIHLEVEEEGDSLRGRVSRSDTKAIRDFVGWLGLVAALDGLIARLPSEGSTARSEDVPSTDREGARHA